MHPEHRLGAAVAASGEQLRAHGGGRAWGRDEGGEVGHGGAAAVADLVGRIPCVRRPFEAARACPGLRGGRRARRCAAAITKRASAASSERASMAGGVTCSGEALVSQCAPEAPIGVTFRQKASRYQRTARFVLNRGGKSLSPLEADPAQSLTQGSTASGVRPSVECFRRTDASAPPAESLLAPKNFFAKASFTQRLPPLWDGTIFGQVFVRGGMTKFSKWKVPPTGGSSAPADGARADSRAAWPRAAQASSYGVAGGRPSSTKGQSHPDWSAGRILPR